MSLTKDLLPRGAAGRGRKGPPRVQPAVMQENDIAPCCGGGRFIPSAPRFSFLVTIRIRSLSAVTAADRKSPDCAPSPPIPRYCWFLLYSSQQSRIYEELLHCVLQEGGSWECHGTSSWKDGTHGKSTRSPRRDTGVSTDFCEQSPPVDCVVFLTSVPSAE